MSRFTNRTNAFLLGLLATTAWGAMPAQASDYVPEAGMSSLVIGLNGSAPTLTVENVANSNQVSDVVLAVKENSVAVPVAGEAVCTGTQFENWAQRFGHYLSSGAFGVGETGFVVKQDLPSSTSIDRESASGNRVFNVSVNQLKGAQIGIDPAALVMQAANAAPNKIEFLRNDQLLVATVPLRMEGTCNYYTRNKVTKNTVTESGKLTHHAVDVELRINYKGDPDLQQMNLQVANAINGGGQGGIQSNPQNFITVNNGTFLQGEVHKAGRCPMTANFKLELTGAGDGQVKIQVQDYGDSSFKIVSPPIDFVKGKAVFDFSHELKRIAPYHMLNTTYNHNYKVHYSAKPNGEQFFPANYQPLPVSLQWTHECTDDPVVNPSLSQGGLGGKLQQPADGANPTPTVPTIGTVQAVPLPGGVRPTPTMGTVQAQPVSPTPRPMLNVQAQPVSPTPRPVAPTLNLQAVPGGAEQPSR